jgi:hypothetical protein
LPKHLVTDLIGLGCIIRKFIEFFFEGFVGVRFFMLLKGLPVCDDGDVIFGLPFGSDRAFIENKSTNLYTCPPRVGSNQP